MIKIVGQATQRDGTSPVWKLTGICTSASRTGTGTYTITCSKAPNSKLVVLISAERGGVGTERTIATWSNNVLTVKNYTGQASTTLGDCWLTVTFLEDISPVSTYLSFENNNRIVFKQ